MYLSDGKRDKKVIGGLLAPGFRECSRVERIEVRLLICVRV
jgi:hypothetical protein